MNNESFEKMDREFLSSLKDVREKKVPEEIRRDFKRSVEERLASAGQPGFGLSLLAAPALVLVLGAALCWVYLKPAPPVQENIPVETELQKKETVTEALPAPMPVAAPAPVPAAVRKIVHSDVQMNAQLPKLAQITESNIVNELEALKELGVWTEKDEEEIGITSDQIFEELETLAGELISGGTSSGVPQTSAQ